MQAAEAKERLEVAVTGTFAAQKIEACGDVGEKATPTVANMDAVQSPIENWPPMSKKAAEQTLDKYGPPKRGDAYLVRGSVQPLTCQYDAKA